MKNKMLVFTLIGLVSVGASINAFAAASNQGTTVTGNKTSIEQSKENEDDNEIVYVNANVKLTEAQASAIALNSAGSNAKVVKAQLENENGTLVYSVDMVLNNNKIEANVDVNTGTILKDTKDTDNEEADDENDLVENDDQITDVNVKLTAAEASTIALNSADPNAKVVKVELENENGVLAYGIDMILNNKNIEVNVDANSGKILASDNNQEVNFR